MSWAGAVCRRAVTAVGAATPLRTAHTFAVVHVGGKQYKVTQNDVIVTNKLQCEVGSHIRLEKVLLVGNKDKTLIGQPILSREEAKVTALVAEQSKGAKVIAFKKKRRQGYARLKEHEADQTFLRIKQVQMAGEMAAADTQGTRAAWPSSTSTQAADAADDSSTAAPASSATA